MAKCEKKEEVVRTTTYVLTLTEAEAITLRTLAHCAGGNAGNHGTNLATISDSLSQAGVRANHNEINSFVISPYSRGY